MRPRTSHVRLFGSRRRYVSTQPQISRSFPPREAAHYPENSKFDPSQWAAVQPPPASALTAFAHRTGLSSILSSPSLVQQVCTHPSFSNLHALHYPNEPTPPTNAALAALGNSLMGLFATEYLNAAYPHLPTRALKAAVSAYVGPSSCSAVAREMGGASLLRWDRTPPTLTKAAILHADALASIPRALTALIYQQRSLPTARKFVESFFLSREVDLRPLIKFRDPKMALSETVNKFGRERPISRLLKETGRASNSPVFVVGIFSGSDQLGEGFGSSLRMAEYRAAEDSLNRLYLTRQPEHLLTVPTSTFSSGTRSAFDHQAEQGYVPGQIGESEVLYGWSEGRRTQVSAVKRGKRSSSDEGAFLDEP